MVTRERDITAPHTRRHAGRGWAIALALLFVLAWAPAASAHVHVFIGGVFGVPGFGYAYVQPAPYPYAYGYAYPAYQAYVPPPRCARGHWAWRHDAWGRHGRVWVPAYRR